MRILICGSVIGCVCLLSSPGWSRGQSYEPPPANLPSDEAMKEITEKGKRLAQALTTLKNQGWKDQVLVDIEVYLRAAESIVQHKEFYSKDSTAWTLAVLDRGLMRARLLSAGETPWLTAFGQTVARGYRSRVDGSVQPFAVTYPLEFGKDPEKRWRVDVVLHGRDTSLTEVKFLHANSGDRAVPKEQDFIQITIFGRGNNAYRWSGESDVFEAMDAYGNSENIVGRAQLTDNSHVVLRGFSMGGAGTWHLGLHWPDRWCCIGPGAGFTTTHGYVANLKQPLPAYQEACLHIYDAVDYALNAFDVPVVAYSGSEDPQKKAADNIEAILQKAGIPMDHLVAPGLGHSFPPAWFHKANELYTKHATKPPADHVDMINFVTYTLKYPGCRWLTLLGLDKHYDKASVLAAHTDAGYNLRTENVRALRIMLADQSGKPHDVTIDGQKLVAQPSLVEAGTYAVFLQRRGPTWLPVLRQRLDTQQQQRPRKVHGLQGPIDDAFSEAFLCVRSTGKGWHEATRKLADARLERFHYEWSKFWRGQLPVKSDTEVTADDIAGRHLILFGDPASNSLIAQVLDGLPLEWNRDQVRFAGRVVSAERHLPVLIYPNPLNAQRYVVLNTGHTIPTGDYTKTNALLFPRFGDYALLRAGENGAEEVVTAGLFDDAWAIAGR
jgi:dienelactone hydrolase